MQSKFYMKDEAPFQDYPAYVERPKRKSKAAVFFFVVILIILATVAGLYLLGVNSKSASDIFATPTEAPLPTEVPTPTATPTPVLERSELEVSVLNGSGVAGAANQTSAVLKSLGYVVGTTGNADNFEYEGIAIKVKKDKSGYADLLKKDLTASSSAASVTASVDDTIPTDAQVIVGR